MPIHSHDSAEGLKPEWVSKPAQKLVASVMMNNRFGDYGAQPRHSGP
jgi:hypothetical protein